MKIGIIREGKKPVDKRVALTPTQASSLMQRFPDVKIYAQPSPSRCFADDEYVKNGISLQEDLSECDILLGVKEVPIDELIPNKTYFFFSHTIKKQPYNRPLLRAILEKNIRLIDYETLTDEKKNRVIAFGRYAGIVGAYNGIRGYGIRHNLFELKPVHTCFDREEMNNELQKAKLPNIKIAITGGGRVANGAIETLAVAKIKQVSSEDLIHKTFNEPVFAQLNSKHYHKRKDGREFISAEFYSHPENFEADFLKYASEIEMLVACAFWHQKAPVLFNLADIQHKDFKINFIADVTCDIDGSIPTTKRASTVAEPFYDFDKNAMILAEPFSSQNHITVMAVDNLPSELPRNASMDFGQIMLDLVLTSLLEGDKSQLIARAAITENGHLTKNFDYLHDYVYAQI